MKINLLNLLILLSIKLLLRNKNSRYLPVEHINTKAKTKTRLQMVQGFLSIKNPNRYNTEINQNVFFYIRNSIA